MNDIADTRIRSLSKICDVVDLFDPAVDQIMRDRLRVTPVAMRRTWEFAIIYHALQNSGALHPNARGLGMGVGTERLLYALADAAKEVYATDLYESSEGWETIRTEDPQAFLLGSAPWASDKDNIKAMHADMRDLPFEDNQFDFAWSAGSIEHIGEDEDFIKHLNEVNRVLRPGGIYSFTTIVSFDGKTHRIPHNYYFDPHHLADIVNRSEISPTGDFDCRLTEHTFNRPMVESLIDFGAPGLQAQINVVTSYRNNIIPLTANVITLTKADPGQTAEMRVVGYQESAEWVQSHCRRLTREMWKNWQGIALAKQPNLKVLRSGPHNFGRNPVQIEVDCSSSASELELEIISALPSPPTDQRVELQSTMEAGVVSSIQFQPIEGRNYLIKLNGDAPEIPDSASVRARSVSGDDDYAPLLVRGSPTSQLRAMNRQRVRRLRDERARRLCDAQNDAAPQD